MIDLCPACAFDSSEVILHIVLGNGRDYALAIDQLEGGETVAKVLKVPLAPLLTLL